MVEYNDFWRRQADRILQQAGITPDTYDVAAHWDNTLSAKENLHQIRKQVHSTSEDSDINEELRYNEYAEREGQYHAAHPQNKGRGLSFLSEKAKHAGRIGLSLFLKPNEQQTIEYKAEKKPAFQVTPQPPRKEPDILEFSNSTIFEEQRRYNKSQKHKSQKPFSLLNIPILKQNGGQRMEEEKYSMDFSKETPEERKARIKSLGMPPKETWKPREQLEKEHFEAERRAITSPFIQRPQKEVHFINQKPIKETFREAPREFPKTFEEKSLKEKIKGYFVRSPEEDAQHLREQRAYAETFYKAKEAAMRKRGVKEGWNAGLNPRAARKGAGRSAFGAFFGDTMNTIGKMSVNANRMNQNALLGIPRTQNPNQPFYDPFAHFLPNYKPPVAKAKHKHHKSKNQTRTIVLKI